MNFTLNTFKRPTMDKTEKALSYFDNKYNCAQSVLVAFAEECGLKADEALKVSSAFGGGMGRQQHTCGAVTGAAMALGLKFGKGENDSDDKKLLTYDKTIELFAEFAKQNGSSVCLELLDNLVMRNENDLELINKNNLFHTRCRKYVADAVRITENIITNH